MKLSALQRLVAWLAEFQTRRPWLVLLLAIVSVVPSAWAVSSLQLRTAFQELLPDDKPSVIELRRVSDRLPSASTLTVVAESENTDLLKRFVDEMTPKLRALPPDLVTGVDPGPKEAQRFFEENKHLYASLADIQELHDEVVGAYDREVAKKSGLDLGLDDEEEAPAPPPDQKKLEQRLKDALEEVRKSAPGMDGYYIGENGRLAAILVRTTLPSMDQRAYDLEKLVEKLAEEGGYSKVDPNFRLSFTGNLITSAEQYRVVNDDLIKIGASGVAMVLLVVFLYFLRVRALIALGISIGIGCIWSLAFARISVGHLNIATGFLVSIIAGNGINAMVIWMARYLEARRQQHQGVAEAVRTASVETCEATLAVVGVAMVSYGALMTTDFRGFRHFGIIGGAGMLLSWIATYAVLPAIFVLSERFIPLPLEPTWRDKLGANYGRPFAWIAKALPVPVAVVGLLLGVAGTIGSILYFVGDPMEYDLRNVLNEEQSPTSAGRLSTRVNKIAGRLNQGGRAVLVDRLDQVKPLVAELERRRDAAPAHDKPFDKVVSVYSLLPADQEKKIELLKETLDRVERARKRGFISEERYQEIAAHIPRELRPIDITDLPDLVARPFRERNGEVGKVIYVSPAAGRSLNDAHYLMLWANSFRTVTLPNGDVIHGTGDAVVFSDMLLNIAEDAPRVALTSLVGTLLVIMFAFRWRRAGWGALATLLLGISWLVGTLYFANIKLNFLNFVALPVAIGAGADYAINIMKRREIEGPEGIERAFVETGGAVIACSMTTLSGYLALLLSINGAVRSFGLAAAIGEVSTQLSAMLVLPAVMYWAAKRKPADKSKPSAESASPVPSQELERTG
jgi:predicted RND superfamily exporter protein